VPRGSTTYLIDGLFLAAGLAGFCDFLTPFIIDSWTGFCWRYQALCALMHSMYFVKSCSGWGAAGFSRVELLTPALGQDQAET
jgi:hypothetical protein